MDYESAALAIQLQSDDVESVLCNAKGKGRAEDANDEDFAFQLLLQDLKTAVITLDDHKMCKSIARAVRTDSKILEHEEKEQQAAVRDRELACALEGREMPNDTSTPQEAPLEQEFLAKLTALFVSEEEGIKLLANSDSSDEAESSGTGSRANPIQSSLDRLCEICRDHQQFYDVASLPCGHEYCRECLDGLFDASTKDESLFPPRCCRQRVPFSSVRVFLSAKTAKNFQEKSPELETPNRTYCSQPTCSAWIHPKNIADDVGACATCHAATCVFCKAAAHTGECPADEATQQLLRAAEANGWQRCYQCRRVIDLNFGCNHITCVCGAQFCYICGEPWKSCNCPQWEENRLYSRAEQIFDRGRAMAGNEGRAEENGATVENVHQAAEFMPPEGAAANNLRALRINAIMDDLQLNHNCAHSSWRFVPGSHQCEECLYMLPQFIFECRQCQVRACKRCRRNRM